ncbi:hypothetical protein GMDG_00927 [Pseudogymnoascus destructans 20631-21]|uniref:Cation/H+ exchanger transmembrane domain-containing protein n=1 Tax=Pseudogymnoascus destructans (strain ATCC MYA-4855 / 20631-21) TaxID=658429 RepID=L8FLL3_PSED2|nr:hypothetical protein GMDG_00927 [Pseudogymnoascus destructans 20631-21]
MSNTISSAVSKTAAGAAAATTGLRATPQGGILEGANPATYDPKNPIILFIIQVIIIIIFCRLLHYPLSLIRQPRVIAEVIGGIILGPSVMAHIPGFKAAIFPDASLPILNLVANLGLILFLFLVALETDLHMFMRNWRVALSVGLAGMILPFGLGCGIAYGLYHQFRTDEGIVPISFPVYMLFIGTALSITAFPVLCRILTELNLLGTPVGVTVLAAGVGNDVVGWVLLALCVALVNNGSGITALYVVLCTVGWILFLFYAVRPCLVWLLRRTGSIKNGPTQGMITLVLLLTLFSAWFTGVIGVHPIFGGFLVGLICPHDEGFTVKLTEKIEDLVTVLFLPLYFALSGLNTNLGLLNDGTAWAYVVGIIAVALIGKIVGGTLAARSCKLVWRESLTIGVLMSCKGLVELIVLNIGLQAKILSTRTFTMFVIMALVTTVITSPATSALYPPWYQKKLEAWKRGDIDWEGNELRASADSLGKLESTQIHKLLVYLRLESLPALFTFIDLLGGEKPAPITRNTRSKSMARVSSHSPSVPQDSSSDAILNTFRTFARLNALPVSGTISTVPLTSFATQLLSKTSSLSPDLLLVPWPSSLPADSEADAPPRRPAPFTPGAQSAFISELLSEAPCNAAILIDRSFGAPVPSADRGHHIFFPFIGGPDDRVALRFVLQLAKNRHVTATVLQVIHTAAPEVKPPRPTAPGIGAEAFAPRLGMGSRRGSRASVVAAAEEADAIIVVVDSSVFSLVFGIVLHSIPKLATKQTPAEATATRNADVIATLYASLTPPNRGAGTTSTMPTPPAPHAFHINARHLINIPNQRALKHILRDSQPRQASHRGTDRTALATGISAASRTWMAKNGICTPISKPIPLMK